jgi:hypothetical protein
LEAIIKGTKKMEKIIEKLILNFVTSYLRINLSTNNIIN